MLFNGALPIRSAMRLLAFTDTHEDPGAVPRLRRLVAQERVDIVVCAGDFTIMGRGLLAALKELNGLGAPLVLIPGNHEDPEEVEAALVRYENIVWAHERLVTVKGVPFVGFGGGGFRRREPCLEDLDREIGSRIDGRTILLSHAPPAETALDMVGDDWHVGNETLTDIIRRRKPLLALCGHIHECFHARDTLAGTIVINPGPDGEIIELEAGADD